MFGFSFGELVVLVIVAVVVIGPKELPKVLRKLGQWSGKLRRMASELRAQSGIDDVLKGEGIAEDIAEIRRLARGEIDNISRATRLDQPPQAHAAASDPYSEAPDAVTIVREREYPREGADSYRALPETAFVYASTLSATPLATDPLYITGDPSGVVPPLVGVGPGGLAGPGAPGAPGAPAASDTTTAAEESPQAPHA